MRNVITCLSVVVVMGATAGCPLGPTGLCEAELRANCHRIFTCCKNSELQDQLSFLTYVNSEGECYDRLQSICKTSGGPLEDAIGLGRLQFNYDKATTCMNVVNAAADKCDPSVGIVPECEETTLGLVKDGDKCAQSAECGDGGLCDIDPQDPTVNEDTGALEGKCKGPQDKGDDCADKPCKRGLICVVDTGGNASCDDAPQKGDDCVGGQCGAGLFCDAGNSCTERKDDDADCTDPGECKTDQCTDGACGTGTCTGK